MAGLRLIERRFVDIVLGEDYCDIKIEEPRRTLMENVEGVCPDDVKALRDECRQRSQCEGPEFTIHHDSLRFRVTTMASETGQVWFLSRIDAQVRPIHQLHLPAQFVTHSIKPRLQGLLLVTGGFGAGKTTLASSLFSHRVSTLGGTGLTLEDPAGEVRMDGSTGFGRIVRIPVAKATGGYQAALQLVRRSRADIVLIGEIRDPATAIEAQDIANTDMPVFATMHASSIEEAFDKYQAYLRARHASSAEANARLALSINGVVHMTKEYVTAPDGTHVPRFIPRCLTIDRTDPKCLGIIGKIREGNFISLNDDITFQATRRFHDARG